MNSEILDTRGEICPIPLIKTFNKLSSMKNGDELTVISDHPPTRRSIPMELTKRGLNYFLTESNPEFEIHITVTN